MVSKNQIQMYSHQTIVNIYQKGTFGWNLLLLKFILYCTIMFIHVLCVSDNLPQTKL